MNKLLSLEIAGLVGKKWTIPVMLEVESNGRDGFNAICRRLRNISPKLLSQRLKELEKGGILQKELIADRMPVRTKYRLTESGKQLKSIVNNLKVWSDKHQKNLSTAELGE